MNQPEQANSQVNHESVPLTASDLGLQTNAEVNSATVREWLPEDEDDWYEPDCCRTERFS